MVYTDPSPHQQSHKLLDVVIDSINFRGVLRNRISLEIWVSDHSRTVFKYAGNLKGEDPFHSTTSPAHFKFQIEVNYNESCIWPYLAQKSGMMCYRPIQWTTHRTTFLSQYGIRSNEFCKFLLWNIVSNSVLKDREAQSVFSFFLKKKKKIPPPHQLCVSKIYIWYLS